MTTINSLGGDIEYIAEHDLTTEEVEHVLSNPVERDMSDSSGRPIVFGYTAGGRFITVVYEEIDLITVYPITAFDVEN